MGPQLLEKWRSREVAVRNSRRRAVARERFVIFAWYTLQSMGRRRMPVVAARRGAHLCPSVFFRRFALLAVAAQFVAACGGPGSDDHSVASRPDGHMAGSDSGTDAASGAGAESEAGTTMVGSIAGLAGDAAAGGGGNVANPAPEAGAAGTVDVFVPAPHTALPLVTAHGGPVIQNIELVAVYFGDDPLRADLERFNSWIVASDYWTQVGAEYGVQPGTHLPGVHFESAPASISEAQIASWIDARVADGSLPKPSANTVFALFYPASTTITRRVGQSCVAFAGFHGAASVDNPVSTGIVPFTVIPRCSFEAGDELMIATDVASHEYFEAATVPLLTANTGWFMDGTESGALEAWGMLSGPELADLCLNQSYDMIDGFSVNDVWSNEAAQAGNNPCQPSDPKHPFFSVSSAETIYHALPGTTLIIHALAWSNLPAPAWELGVNWGWEPYSDFDGQAVLSTTTVNNGDELTATVTIPANPPKVGGRSLYSFIIDSIDPINPNFSHPWPILVIVP